MNSFRFAETGWISPAPFKASSILSDQLSSICLFSSSSLANFFLSLTPMVARLSFSLVTIREDLPHSQFVVHQMPKAFQFGVLGELAISTLQICDTIP